MGQSLKTKKLLSDRILNSDLIYLKLVNFGPHISAFLKSPEKIPKMPKICEPKS